ncbi:hypothetical protein SH139x_003662 [Planctomycetaceae bacterium SH139]
MRILTPAQCARYLCTPFLCGLFLCAPTLLTAVAAQESFIGFDEPMPASVIGVQWVRPNAEGQITGQVVLSGGGDELAGDVLLIDRAGSPKTFSASKDGSFLITDATPGLYTIAYRSTVGFAAFAMHIMDEGSESLPSHTMIPAARLSPRQALSTISRYQPVRTPEAPSISGPAQQSMANTVASIRQLAQDVDGGVSGRIIEAGSSEQGLAPAGGMNVLLLQDGIVRGQAVTNFDGRFQIKGMGLGEYDLVASGPSGYAAVGFQLVESLAAQSAGLPSTRDGQQFVSTVSQPPPAPASPGITLQAAPSGPGFTTLSEGRSDEGITVFEPFGGSAPGGFSPASGGGGFGGGGLGGGGGGGLGGIGGLAAIGGVIAAVVASDDDDDNFVPSVSSPATP